MPATDLYAHATSERLRPLPWPPPPVEVPAGCIVGAGERWLIDHDEYLGETEPKDGYDCCNNGGGIARCPTCRGRVGHTHLFCTACFVQLEQEAVSLVEQDAPTRRAVVIPSGPVAQLQAFLHEVLDVDGWHESFADVLAAWTARTTVDELVLIGVDDHHRGWLGEAPGVTLVPWRR